MEPFEYVIVLVSLILGLGLAQLLNGLADMLAQYKKTNFSTAHTIFIIVILMVFIQDWWYSYQYSNQIEVWTLPMVLALLSFPIVLFLLARFLFPTGSRSLETDMKLYFFDNWRWLYGLFASTIAISITQNILISGYTLTDQIPFIAYLLWYIVFIALNIKNMKYHNVFMVIQLIAWFAFLYFEPNTLSNSN